MKFPQMPYLTVSPSKSDKLPTLAPEGFRGKAVMLTTKMDGTGVSFSSKTLGPVDHFSFDRLKACYSCMRWAIPDHMIFFAEWLYAMHSIHYAGDLALKSYLMVFALYDELDRMWASWSETTRAAGALSLETVPVLDWGRYDNAVQLSNWIAAHGEGAVGDGHEGLVLRTGDEFPADEFTASTGKYVREGHVAGDHWRDRGMVRNELRLA